MVVYDLKQHTTLEKFGFSNPTNEVNKKMKSKVQKAINLEDGSYNGIVTGTELKETKGYEYFYIYIKEEKTELTLNCSVPASITEKTALGKILTNFGAKLEEGKEIDTDDFIKEGVKVTFLIKNDGKFAQIVRDSLKPSQ